MASQRNAKKQVVPQEAQQSKLSTEKLYTETKSGDICINKNNEKYNSIHRNSGKMDFFLIGRLALSTSVQDKNRVKVHKCTWLRNRLQMRGC